MEHLEALTQAAENRDASSTVGSSTSTVWNRRSRAASFSMCFRYSANVVAPIMCGSPGGIGLSMFPRPSPPHRTTDDGVQLVDEQEDPALGRLHFAEYCLETLLELTRYLAPAINAPISRANTVLSSAAEGRRA